MEKIKNLQKSLSRLNLDGYIIPKNDEFFSSDIEPNEDRLRFISNFTGSYGLALILKTISNNIWKGDRQCFDT